LHSPTLITTDLRWKIDALPDPTQTTESLISGRVEVRRQTGLTIVRGTADRRVINRPDAAATGDLPIIEPEDRRRVRMTRGGATVAPMGDSHERTGSLLAVTINVVLMRDAAQLAALRPKNLNRTS